LEREIATLGEAVQVRLVPGLAPLVQEHGHLTGEDGFEQELPIQHVVCCDIDPHDQLEAEDRLAQGAPDRGIDQFGPLAAVGRPGTADCLPSQPIERCHRRVLRQERGHVRLDVSEGVSLGQPAKDELRGRERLLDPGQASFGCHRPSSGKAASSSE
jgi:hypothetical protein